MVDHPNSQALVLLSAAGGGPNATQTESAAGLLLGDRYDALASEAGRLVAQGRGDELMQIPGWWWVISARSLVDRLQGLPDLVALAPSIVCPTLFLKGKAEPEAIYPARAFAAACGDVCQLVELECDHWYTGKDGEVAAVVADWLGRTLSLEPASVA